MSMTIATMGDATTKHPSTTRNHLPINASKWTCPDLHFGSGVSSGLGDEYGFSEVMCRVAVGARHKVPIRGVWPELRVFATKYSLQTKLESKMFPATGASSILL